MPSYRPDGVEVYIDDWLLESPYEVDVDAYALAARLNVRTAQGNVVTVRAFAVAEVRETRSMTGDWIEITSRGDFRLPVGYGPPAPSATWDSSRFEDEADEVEAEEAA